MTERANPICLRDVRFAWPGGQFGLAVDRFDLEMGQTMLLTGASGSGKSTLLALICGLVRPSRGYVSLLGTDVTAMRGRARDRLRADLFGIIFQQFNLLPYATAVDNICLPLRFSAARRRRVSDPVGEALALGQALGLPGDMMTTLRAADLSVGQQQRVAVARAMLGDPPIIVADEPASALDAEAQDGFLELLFSQVDARGASLLMVSHDQALAHRFDVVQPLSDLVMPWSEVA